MYLKSLVLIVMVCVVAMGCQSLSSSPTVGPALDNIRGSDIAAHLRFLSLDLLEGRAPATRGGNLAAEYLATQLAALDFAPAGDDDTYFQEMNILESTVHPQIQFSLVGGPSFEYLTEVVAVSDLLTPKVSISGEVVFVGHGIVAPELHWNDYADIDMTDRIALVMVNDPPATPEEPDLFGGDALTYYGRWTYKYEEAARQGAAGVILIHTDESATYPWQVVQSSWSGPQYSLLQDVEESVLTLKAWVSEPAARRLTSHAGYDLDVLRSNALQRGARPVPLGVLVSGSIQQDVVRSTASNVIGVLQGTDTSQGVLFTAHYDHLGMIAASSEALITSDQIFNGAVDNASGVAGLLEISQALARSHTRPVRSIYVVFTTAEEAGLLGAEYFALHSPLPLNQWAANINVDGLNLYGRTRDIVLLGADRSTLGVLANSLAKARNRIVGLDPAPERGYFFRSDHFPMAKAGIPAVSLGSPTDYIGQDAEHGKRLADQYNENDYHQPSDDFRTNWNYIGAVEDLQLLAELGWYVAMERVMPKYYPDDPFSQFRAEIP